MTAGVEKMELAELLDASRCSVGSRYADKAACLGDLSRQAATALSLDRDLILRGLKHREALGSTGLGLGIGLPHARLDAVAEPYILLRSLREPIAFEAIDERPVDLVCLVLLPTDPEPTNALALVARRLRNPDVLRALRGAKTAEALRAAMVGG